MKAYTRSIPVIFATVLAPLATQAKGVEDLQPQEQKIEMEHKDELGDGKEKKKKKKKKKKNEMNDSIPEMNEDGLTKEQDNAKSAAELVTDDQYKDSKFYQLTHGRLHFSTSHGFSTVSADSVSWRSSGMSDIKMSYLTDLNLINMPTYFSFRYAASEVSPKLKIDNKNQEFKGVLQFYSVGSQLDVIKKDKTSIYANVELSMVTAHLKDTLDLLSKEVKKPAESGFNLIVGGGANWMVAEQFSIGGLFNLGFGSYMTTQLAGTVNLVF